MSSYLNLLSKTHDYFLVTRSKTDHSDVTISGNMSLDDFESAFRHGVHSDKAETGVPPKGGVNILLKILKEKEMFFFHYLFSNV